MRRTAVSETSPKLRAELEGIPTYKPGKPAATGGPERGQPRHTHISGITV